MTWQRSPRIAAAVVVAWLLVQLAVPLWNIASDDQDRFAWRMFSTFEPRPTFVVHTPTGQAEADLVALTARLRGDLELEAHIPAHLCDLTEDAVRVSWEPGEHLCVVP